MPQPDPAATGFAGDPARRFEIVEGVFAPAFCRWLLDEARRIHAAGSGFHQSNEVWDRDVVEDSERVLVHQLAGKPLEMICALLRQRGMIEDGEAYVLLHAWTAGSYIPWHTDGRHRGAVTVYLNDRWEGRMGRPLPPQDPRRGGWCAACPEIQPGGEHRLDGAAQHYPGRTRGSRTALFAAGLPQEDGKLNAHPFPRAIDSGR